jgi:hypothetical protein
VFFSTLRYKVVVVTHDGVDRYFVWTVGLTHATSMPTIEGAELLRIGRQKRFIFGFEPTSRKL